MKEKNNTSLIDSNIKINKSFFTILKNKQNSNLKGNEFYKNFDIIKTLKEKGIKLTKYNLGILIWGYLSLYEKYSLKNAKTKGAFYTNYEIAYKIIKSSFDKYFKDKENINKKEIKDILKEKQILEPANGSGLFIFVLLDILTEYNFSIEEQVSFLKKNITTVEIDKDDSKNYFYLLELYFNIKKDYFNINNGKDNEFINNIILNKSNKYISLYEKDLKHYTKNFFDINFNCKFDFIFGNPPYGLSLKNEKEKISKFFNIDGLSNESYGLFFLQCFSVLNKQGFLSFITPDTFLNNKTFYSFRKALLKDFIEIILCPKNIFKNPFTNLQPGTNSCITTIQKNTKQNYILLQDSSKDSYKFGYNFKIKEKNDKQLLRIKKEELEKIFLIPINMGLQDQEIKNILVYKKYKGKNIVKKVKDVFDSTMGIKTANNKKFIETKKTKNNLVFIKGTSKEKQEYTSGGCGYLNLEKLKKEKTKNTNIPNENFLDLDKIKIGIPEIGHKGEIRAFSYKNAYVSNSIWIYKLKDNILKEKFKENRIKNEKNLIDIYLKLFNSNIYKQLSLIYSNGIRIEKHIIDNLPLIENIKL